MPTQIEWYLDALQFLYCCANNLIVIYEYCGNLYQLQSAKIDSANYMFTKLKHKQYWSVYWIIHSSQIFLSITSINAISLSHKCIHGFSQNLWSPTDQTIEYRIKFPYLWMIYISNLKEFCPGITKLSKSSFFSFKSVLRLTFLSTFQNHSNRN